MLENVDTLLPAISSTQTAPWQEGSSEKQRPDWREYSGQMEEQNRIYAWVNAGIIWKIWESQGENII